jgi:hypothetical protein
MGTLGAESETGGSTSTWSSKAEDFVTRRVPEGVVTPWAINLDTLRVGFQMKPRLDRGAFVRSLRLLMNEAAGDDLWEVRPDVRPIDFDAWLQGVDAVHNISVRVDRPNPHYGDNQEVENMIEGSHAEKVRIAAEGADLSVESSDVIRESIAHADRGYGSYVITGTQGGATTRFDSERAQAPPEVEVPADSESGDALGRSLRQTVEDTGPVPSEDLPIRGARDEVEESDRDEG